MQGFKGTGLKPVAFKLWVQQSSTRTAPPHSPHTSRVTAALCVVSGSFTSSVHRVHTSFHLGPPARRVGTFHRGILLQSERGSIDDCRCAPCDQRDTPRE
jgi:hypothetical protein